MAELSQEQNLLLDDARRYFAGHLEAVGVLTADGIRPIFLKSGIDGGPWGGTQRGGIPRGRGYSFTSGGPSQGNISTHVEGHAAAIMWQRGLKKAALVVDRPMCRICSRDLPNALPPGAKLVVYSAEEGETILWGAHAG